MCGRYATTMDPETLYGIFDAEPGPEQEPGLYGGDPPRPRYNIAPTTENPVVRLRLVGGAEGEPRPVRTVEALKWGLVPSWAKDGSTGNRMFNARSESAASTSAFRTALAKRRCLVPASGFYEWRKPEGDAPKGTAAKGAKGKPAKQPFYITPQDGSVMAFAGLWEYWRRGEESIVSYTILTTEAVGEMRTIHDRMPLILPATDWSAWLDPDTDPETISGLLRPPDLGLVEQLEFRPVGSRVGNVANDDADLLSPVDPADEQPTLL